jgi:tRNA wybutosine-synthesizing protein 2
MGFKQLLTKELSGSSSIPEDLLPLLPSGFQDLDGRAILNLKPELRPYAEEIAVIIPKINKRIKAVWMRAGQITGKFREPQGLLHVWGEESTEVIVNENGVRYKFDFTKIMFAKGNIHERGLLPKRLQPGETIIDMYSGIGYFTLGMGKSKKPVKIYSIEWNPTSFKYLQKNIKLNKLDKIVQPIFGDCKVEILKLVESGVRADRIVMGLLPAPVDAIPMALEASKPEGTIVVYEGVEQKDSTQLYDEFQAIAENAGYRTELVDRRLVKAFKPHEYHVVLEIKVTAPSK